MYKSYILSLVLALVILSLPEFVSAQNPVTQSFSYAGQIGEGALGSNQLQDVIVSVVNVMLSFTAIIFTSTIIYGGFLYHTGHFNEEDRNYAVATIKSGVIGIFFIIASMSISRFVLSSVIDATGGNAPLTF